MPGGVDFDEGVARALERMYQTPDVVGQRSRLLQVMELQSGQQVLDVGSGPGLLAVELAATVGSTGRVRGVDQSEPMVRMAAARCEAADQDWAEFEVADATELPYGDAEFDAVVSTQVLEYVPDVKAALAEAWRVLRPGGRVFVLDTDWDSLVWHSSDRERTARVLAAWDEHLAHPHLPAFLSPWLRDAGFVGLRREVIPILNPEWHDHSYSAGILRAIHAFVPARAGVTQIEADAWAEDLYALARNGSWFFSLNRYLFSAFKPGG